MSHDERLHVILCHPEIAANAGAIGRTCVAAGAMLWLVRPLGFHLDDRYLRRARLDYWDHLEYRMVDGLDEVAAILGRDRLWSFSTRAAGVLHRRARLPARRRAGLRPREPGPAAPWLAERPDRAVRIPIRPEARSLNLANAVAIGLFEAVRQLGGFGPWAEESSRNRFSGGRREDRQPAHRENRGAHGP